MQQFTVFHSSDSFSLKLMELINQYKLEEIFNIIQINYSQIHLYSKYLHTIPTIINNKSTDIINKDQTIEFIVRLNLHLNKNKINVIPYYQAPSSFSNFYSDIDKTTETSYSNLSFHDINQTIPHIRTLSETKPLTEKEFTNEYNKKLDERNINAE